MAENKKRSRQPDFSHRETEYLMELVEKYKHIIESKETNAVSLKKKTETWQNLTEEFNKFPEVSKRDTKNLKVLWKNLKQKARKDVASNKRARMSTGGGVCADIECPMPPITQQIFSLIPEQFTPLSNPVDSDADFNVPVEDNVAEFPELLQQQSGESNSEPLNASNVLIQDLCVVNPSEFSDDPTSEPPNNNRRSKFKNIDKYALEYHKARMHFLKEEHRAKMNFMKEEDVRRKREHDCRIELLQEEKKEQQLKIQLLQEKLKSIKK
ncbi:myb/SANT-like DNA-binding domain-containing protein 3 [Centruroides vittatus]|uniref:myb/SANT-like DNA-binding domain-containing protein 3 n=1 Tax=Centruroides vittatus TaxID=120091 RepID=UPI00351031B3